MNASNSCSKTHKGPEHRTTTILSSHPSRPVPITDTKLEYLRVISFTDNPPAMKIAAGARDHDK